MDVDIPLMFFEDRTISDEDWANTPESVKRGLEWLWQDRERLRAQTEQSSRNSSIPPSKDRLQHKKPARKKATGRKPGGQPGHAGTTRPLVPEEQLSAPPLSVMPTSCSCGYLFPADTPITGAPYRHQQFELPAMTPVVTEVLQQHCTCEKCGKIVRASLPAGMPSLRLGPHAQALVTVLTGQYHLSKVSVSTLMRNVFGIPISPASVIAVEQAASAALEAPVAKAFAQAQQAPIKHMDESGWRQQRDLDPGAPADSPLKKSWLWSMTTSDAIIYLIRRSRAEAVAREMLNMACDCHIFHFVLVTDRHGGYNWIPIWARQICWAHLDRDFLAISERNNPVAKRIGKALLKQVDLLWIAWHKYRSGMLSFAELAAELAPVRAQIEQLLCEGHYADEKTKTTCNNLRKLEPALWTFLRVEGVEPTNNTAERAQRYGVCKRDRTFGTQTSAGSRYVERILTTTATCRKNGKNALTYINDVLIAYLHGLEAPPLVDT